MNMTNYTQEELVRYQKLTGEFCKYSQRFFDDSVTDWLQPQIKTHFHTLEEINCFQKHMGEVCKDCIMSPGDGSIGGTHLHWEYTKEEACQ